MATIDYKEKYEQALEVAQRFYNNSVAITKKGLEDIFPELAESDDERIRKRLVEYFEGYYDGFATDRNHVNVHWEGLEVKEVLAWLKKQGKQKSADKVEPKFKIEEKKWYVCTQTYVLRGKIVVIKGQTYQAEKDNVIKGENGCLFIDRHDGKALDYFRSWTIADANDGDVLSWDDSKCIALFKNIYDEDSFNSHGLVGHCIGIFEPRQAYHDIEGAHPATKEQRDQLEKAMADAGYTFDFEKKELRKIEQKPVNRLKITAGNWYVCEMEVMNENMVTAFHRDEIYYCPKDGYLDVGGALFEVGCLDVFRLATEKEIPQPKQGEQKPTKDRYMEGYLNGINDTLKSTVWSEEDEKQARQIERIVNNDGGTKKLQEQIHNWFEYLKERVQPQSQSQWKPSDEQISVLEFVMEDIEKDSIRYAVLNSVLEQLKKLREV